MFMAPSNPFHSSDRFIPGASDFQNMQSAMRSSAPRPQMFSSLRPSSQLPRMTSNQRVGKSLNGCGPNACRFCGGLCVDSLPPHAATQAMGPRAATNASSVTASSVRGVSQYKYATGVRNTQQHINAQPQVTVQQVEWSCGLLGMKTGLRVSKR